MPALTNILLIRHAEKPADLQDQTLTVAGQGRAHAYVAYFQHYATGNGIIKLDHLFAAANSTGSDRSTLTLAPLSAVLGLPVDVRFEDHGYPRLADEIRTNGKYDHSNILICWHHGQLLNLAIALGAPAQSLPALWPDDVFGWLLQLSFDAAGTCSARAINQELMYGDCGRAV
jgi:hypothetical protein